MSIVWYNRRRMGKFYTYQQQTSHHSVEVSSILFEFCIDESIRLETAFLAVANSYVAYMHGYSFNSLKIFIVLS